MDTSLGPWLAFNSFILIMLCLDLGVFHRYAHEVTSREALSWTILWVILALMFGLWIYQDMGAQKAIEYYTGYAIEKSLSIDNVFVFSVIFTSFKIPLKYQHRVLFWGVLGALVMRFLMILGGAALIQSFHPIIYIFGLLLLATGIKMLFLKGKALEPKDHWLFHVLKKYIPLTTELKGQRLWVKAQAGGKWFATPLFIALVFIEFTDLIFAIDSIPAIFAITKDPFIVYTANVFAILGLRSLYFLLAEAITMFRYLKRGLACVLIFVGVKMLVQDIYYIPAVVSLMIVLIILGVSILLSLLKIKEEDKKSV